MAVNELQATVQPTAELTKMLKLSSGQPLPFAVALGKDKDDTVLLIDRRKKGTALVKQLAAAFPKMSDSRRGVVQLDLDTKTVFFTVSKVAPASLTARLVKLLKVTPFRNPVVRTDENLLDEDLPGEDGEPAQAEAAPAPQEEAPAPQEEAFAAPEPDQAAESETPQGEAVPPAQVEALARRVKRVLETVPAAKPAVAEAWRAFRAAVDARDPAARARASALVDVLDRAGEPASAAPASAAGADEYAARADTIWQKGGDRLRQSVEALKASVLDAYRERPEVQSAVREQLARVDQAFGWLDTRLGDKLDEVRRGRDPEQRRMAAREGAAIAAEYVTRARAAAGLRDLEDNPFGVELKVSETLDKVLPAVTKLMQAVR